MISEDNKTEQNEITNEEKFIPNAPSPAKEEDEIIDVVTSDDDHSDEFSCVDEVLDASVRYNEALAGWTNAFQFITSFIGIITDEYSDSIPAILIIAAASTLITYFVYESFKVQQDRVRDLERLQKNKQRTPQKKAHYDNKNELTPIHSHEIKNDESSTITVPLLNSPENSDQENQKTCFENLKKLNMKEYASIAVTFSNRTFDSGASMLSTIFYFLTTSNIALPPWGKAVLIAGLTGVSMTFAIAPTRNVLNSFLLKNKNKEQDSSFNVHPHEGHGHIHVAHNHGGHGHSHGGPGHSHGGVNEGFDKYNILNSIGEFFTTSVNNINFYLAWNALANGFRPGSEPYVIYLAVSGITGEILSVGSILSHLAYNKVFQKLSLDNGCSAETYPTWKKCLFKMGAGLDATAHVFDYTTNGIGILNIPLIKKNISSEANIGLASLATLFGIFGGAGMLKMEWSTTKIMLNDNNSNKEADFGKPKRKR